MKRHMLYVIGAHTNKLVSVRNTLEEVLADRMEFNAAHANDLVAPITKIKAFDVEYIEQITNVVA